MNAYKPIHFPGNIFFIPMPHVDFFSHIIKRSPKGETIVRLPRFSTFLIWREEVYHIKFDLKG
jgi:hypothetical protein